MNGGRDGFRVPERVVALFEDTQPFSQLTADLRARLVSDTLVEYFEPDEQIIRPDSRGRKFLYVVESGCVRLVDPATQHLVDLCGEGDAFGAAALLADPAPRLEAIAAEPTVCALVGGDRFLALCRAVPQFAAFFAGNLTQPTATFEPNPTRDAGGTRLLFGTRVVELARRSPVTCPPETPVGEAARTMRAQDVGSILVVRAGQCAGILTNTDLRNKVVAEQAAMDTVVARLMTSPVVSIERGALVFDALMRMSKHRIHHLVVTETSDPSSHVLGVVSDKDISYGAGNNPVSTVKRLDRARSVGELARIRTEADGHLLRLSHQGVQPHELAEVVTEINDRLTLRLLALAEARLTAQRPDARVGLRWTWLALGSMARREMGLRADQDNAILYEDPGSPAEKARAEEWLKAIAKRVVLGLAECGIPFCEGGVMATNAKWCLPLSRWQSVFRSWILEPEPKALMHASIFFDLRAVGGDSDLLGDLKKGLANALKRERGFFAFLTRNAMNTRPPLSFFRRFLVDRSGEYRHTFDVKLHGLTPVVDLARVLALEGAFLGSANTFARLEQVAERLPDVANLARNATDAFRYLLDLRVGHHLQLLEAGLKPNDHIDPESLSKTQQRMLRAVFSTVEDMQRNLAVRYGAHMMA